MTTLNFIELGIVNYAEALSLQKSLHEKRINGEIPDTVIILEHEKVITIGRHGSEANVFLSKERLAQMGVDLFRVERGGDVTYHCPGQVVCYPIIDMTDASKSVKRLVYMLEEAMIRTAAAFGVTAARDEERPGIWVGADKIGAVGLRIERRVTFHGIALNVNCDLTGFSYILPCGLVGKGVSSIEKISGTPASVEDARRIIKSELSSQFEKGLKEPV